VPKSWGDECGAENSYVKRQGNLKFETESFARREEIDYEVSGRIALPILANFAITANHAEYPFLKNHLQANFLTPWSIKAL
jgi:hypothetical protein